MAPAGKALESLLVQQGGASWPSRSYRNESTSRHNSFVMQRVALSGATLFSLSAQTSGGQGGAVENARIVAFRLDAFAGYGLSSVASVDVSSLQQQTLVSNPAGVGLGHPKVLFWNAGLARPGSAGRLELLFATPYDIGTMILYALYGVFDYDLPSSTAHLAFSEIRAHTDEYDRGFEIAATSISGGAVTVTDPTVFWLQLW